MLSVKNITLSSFPKQLQQFTLPLLAVFISTQYLLGQILFLFYFRFLLMFTAILESHEVPEHKASHCVSQPEESSGGTNPLLSKVQIQVMVVWIRPMSPRTRVEKLLTEKVCWKTPHAMLTAAVLGQQAPCHSAGSFPGLGESFA